MMTVGAWSIWGTQDELDALAMAARMLGLWDKLDDAVRLWPDGTGHYAYSLKEGVDCRRDWDGLRELAKSLRAKDLWREDQ